MAVRIERRLHVLEATLDMVDRDLRRVAASRTTTIPEPICPVEPVGAPAASFAPPASSSRHGDCSSVST
jgi:hypothetical protein